MAGEKKKGKGRKRSKKPLWIAEYLAFSLLAGIIRAIGFKTAMRIGGWLGEQVYRLDKRHRIITENNLADCLKDRSFDELAGIARSVYRNLGYGAIEFLRSDRYGRDPIERHFTVRNYESLERAYSRGKGVVLLTAHCGSWEILALCYSIMGFPFGVVVRPLDNPYLDRAITAVRTMYGNTMINKQKGMRGVLRTLSEGKAVGMLLDQNVTRSEGVFVDFFGRPACTNKGLALIAMKTGVPVVPAFIRRTGLDTHEIEVGDEVPVVDTGDKEADIVANTQAYTAVIEDFVRRYPDQWFWMHNRWKTRPVANSDV
jgi:Kdo2-lipid IVA lauroyltransferase/acyltransferase